MREAYHYWGFAACAYGWMLLNALFFTDKDTSILHGLVVGDDKNLTVLCDHCSIKPEDVIDVCWTSSDYNPGHYLAIDHATEAVVVVRSSSIAIVISRHLTSSLSHLSTWYTGDSWHLPCKGRAH